MRISIIILKQAFLDSKFYDGNAESSLRSFIIMTEFVSFVEKILLAILFWIHTLKAHKGESDSLNLALNNSNTV